MKRQWQVARQFQTCADGQRRWDRAFQLLLEWTAPITQEVTDANRSLSACLNLSVPKTSSGLEILAVREIISHSAPSSRSFLFRCFASHLWSSSQLSFCSSGA